MPTAIHTDVKAGYETWRSGVQGLVHVKTLDAHGDLLNDTVVGAGQILQIQPAARRLNQERVAAPYLDPFLNGSLIPIHLVDGDPDTERLLANPNILDDDAAVQLVSGDLDTLVARLKQITHPQTLVRIEAVAAAADVPMSRAAAIRSRIETLAAGDLRTDANEPDDDPEDEAERRARRRRDEGRMGFDPKAAQRL